MEDEDVIYDGEKARFPFYTAFVEQKKDIDHSSTLYSINAPLQFFHADVADICFSSKSTVDPKYALFCVDLFSSKVYVYPMKNAIEPKCKENDEKMRLQTDLEFQQTEINRLYDNYNVDMFISRDRDGKAFAAEQKIREFKKLFFKSKKHHKATKTSRIDPSKQIRNAVQNMNNTNSQKYGITLEKIEEKSLESKKFREVYDFQRMVRVSKDADRYERTDIAANKKSQRRLRSPLMVGKKFLALAEKLKKKDAPRNLYKSTTENTSFFN